MCLPDHLTPSYFGRMTQKEQQKIVAFYRLLWAFIFLNYNSVIEIEKAIALCG